MTAHTGGQARTGQHATPQKPEHQEKSWHEDERPSASPLAFIERVRGAVRLVALDPAGLALGLRPGLTLADARARVPHLVAVEADPAADVRLLERLADDCDRWTPLVCLDLPDGLILDITGCAHLFGGETALRQRLLARLERLGFRAHAVIAGTPDAARALARFGRSGLVPEGEEARYVASLPVGALDLGEEATLALARAGLKTIGALAGRPSLPLSARFGEAVRVRLARVTGREDIRLTPRRALPDLIAEHRFAEPIGRAEDIEATLEGLVRQLATMLEARGQGGRRFEASFFRADGAVRRIPVETGRPTREPGAVLRLLRERLDSLADPVDPGFGFDLVRLAASRAEPLGALQVRLDGRVVEDEEIAALLDRLTARFGRARVLRFIARDTHDPGRATGLVPAHDAPAGAGSALPHGEPDEAPTRPFTLFDPPHPVEVVAEVPDGPPLRFRWRRVLHQVMHAEGPERIAPEWWRFPHGGTLSPVRDYYRVEDREGRRFWLFRAGLYEEASHPDVGMDTAPAMDMPRWFLHGLFA
ncbi:DNA polymerase Y family protein [Ancylobacter sp. 6x-1]|uniref:DNA polymerase Y family protein n=1 Tax=Ancylobacter crimeensis TaxID=2579147 RepID=A0ABT0D7J3_9HYPH|nr:DNA polymerase Y family protein [Ancylobacter crimeensis]MCK0195914.1 DNA polymerase Y family protein [Ancylobacter crimeensis]